MTYVSYRGIVLSERIQNVLVVVQFAVLGVVSIVALFKVFTGQRRAAGGRPVSGSGSGPPAWILVRSRPR